MRSARPPVARTTGVLLQARGGTIGEVYEARTIIEPPAARLAAENRAKEAALALQAQLAIEHELVDDYVKLSSAIADFHRILLEQCGNVALAVVGQALHDVVNQHLQQAIRQRTPADMEHRLRRAKQGLKWHEQLIALIEAGDGPGAEAHWLRLMKSTSKFWLSDLAATAVIDILD